MSINKKKLFIGGIIAAVIAALVTFFVQSSANATEGEDNCVPQDAWTETIEHPAVTHVVHHDAVTHGVHHEAVTHDETVVDSEAVNTWWHWNGGPDGPSGPPPSDGWNTDNGNHNGFPDDVNVIIQRDKGNSGRSDWFYHQVTPEVSHTVTIVDQEAYDETVVDSEAYDETVIDQEAYDETIEHPAVVCDDTPEQPDALFEQKRISDYQCGDDFQVTFIVTTITPYVWDEETETWVLAPELAIHPRPVHFEEPHAVVACDKPKPPSKPNTPVVHHVTPAPKVGVPTVIDAGL